MTNHTKFLIASYRKGYDCLSQLGVNPANHDPRITYQTFMDMIVELERLREERDLAVSELRSFSCASCVHCDVDPKDPPCAGCRAEADSHINWQWRGPQGSDSE